MIRKAMLVSFVTLGGVALIGQQPRVFTAEQAEAGHAAYDRTCARCHTYSVLGRKKDEGEPPVTSLSDSDQRFIKTAGHVPPLAGKDFLSRWGQKSVAELIARFQVTAGDSSFKFENMTPETTVNITAYVLQVSGAKAGTEPLTRATTAVVNSIVQ